MEVGGLNQINAARAFSDRHGRQSINNPNNGLQTQINQAIAQAGSGATVVVTPRMGPGPDGTLQVVGATVTTTTRTSTDDSALAGTPASRSSRRPTQDPVTALNTLSGRSLSLSAQDEADAFGLTPEEQTQIRELQIADAGVRAHEAQHFRAAGGIASGVPQYQTVQGPDGQLYAVGGSVNVQTTPTSDPEKAARDAQTLIAAATAPGDASAQDIGVARNASFRAASSTNIPENESNPNIADIGDEKTGLIPGITNNESGTPINPNDPEATDPGRIFDVRV